MIIIICENYRCVKFNNLSSKVCERVSTFLLKIVQNYLKKWIRISYRRKNDGSQSMRCRNRINERVNETMFLHNCIEISTKRTFAVIKRLCFCVLPSLCSILYWTNVPKWKWIPAPHKTGDVKALEWNSHQESTIWCIGLPLAEESINIRASRSVVLKARLYRVVTTSSRDTVTLKLFKMLLRKGMFTSVYRFILHCHLWNFYLFIIFTITSLFSLISLCETHLASGQW